MEIDGAILDADMNALVSSARVEGTPVFDRQGERLGIIHSLMIHKQTGQVAYAILSFGGFMGVGRHVFPLPWEMLAYNERQGGYVVEISQQQVRDAPQLDLAADARLQKVEAPMYAYWDMRPYW